MKRIMCLILSLLLSFGFIGCKQESDNDGISKNAKIYSMYATEKYMQDQKIEQDEDASLKFVGIKNEVQSAQLTFTAKKKINNFNFESADLKEKGGDAIISKDLVSIYVERYIEIYNPYISDEIYLSEAGFYPDALVPIEKYILRSEDMVEKGNNQAFWIDVNIAKDVKAGVYEGVFKLTLNEEIIDIPVSLTVYDLEMPDKVNWPTLFSIWYQQIGYGEGDNLDENTYQVYYEFLWSKRLNCADLPPEHSATLKDIVDYVISIIDNPKFTYFRIPSPAITQDKIRPKVEGTYTEEQISAEKERIKNSIKSSLKYVLDRNLELRATEGKENVDILAKAMYYYEDEPARGIRTDCVKIFCELLHKAKKELAAEYAEVFVTHPDLLKSLMNVDEICPSNYFFDNSLTVSENKYNEDGTENEKFIGDGLTWWCPEVDYAFDKASKREFILERQALGEKIWWYLCCSNTPRPSYYVESLPINIRMMSWQQHRWGVEGLLYWDIADFQPGQDMYEDVQYSAYGGGEGILVYPGARYGMKTPVSSWRLEQIRLGQQDLELFTMLDNYLLAAESTVKAQDVSIAIGDTMYKGTTIFDTTTSSQFEEHRIWLLNVLELFKTGKTNEALNVINQLLNK